MFSFFTAKRQRQTDFFPFTIDMHSHILPGIDDGAPDVATAVEMVKALQELGLQRSIATPHIISDAYRNTPETINAALQQLRNALQEAGIQYQVDAAAEYMMDEAFFEKLERGEKLLTLKDDLLLTEFSFGSIPENPKKMCFNIITNGYRPVLAHPERYAYFHQQPKAYHLLHELGFLLQVNLNSLNGYYGPGAQKAAKYILQNDLNHFLGTDAHHERHLQCLQDGRSAFEKGLKGRDGWNAELT